jgi:hypothetical protein
VSKGDPPAEVLSLLKSLTKNGNLTAIDAGGKRKPDQRARMAA